MSTFKIKDKERRARIMGFTNGTDQLKIEDINAYYPASGLIMTWEETISWLTDEAREKVNKALDILCDPTNYKKR